ncbi:hypothetical protein ARHIZOSPH14_30260 [Agromyces rhizosphaerae]|uniref:AbiEi antitoxin C-terminal domain-containing protein n=1 Tax=Agromyces rhizosphaerae TaxID=88374 RepID=A0A9W6FQ77_9MICO|nr:hypothetical protein [Agromyces rhizosphaerae]GLI28784.1 hypothetical protein ARHIZOSPH14_30260 [Agromyces rhizosphaerae]
MSRLPSLLSAHDLPLAELCALRIDGEVMALPAGWAPIDEPDRPEQRARSVRLAVGRDVIAARMTAAWVHGAVAAAPPVPQVCVRIGARRGIDPTVRCELSELQLDEAEIERWGPAAATTPARTAFDLLRAASVAHDHRVAALRLLADAGIGLAEFRDRVSGHRRLPGKRAVLDRLDDEIASTGGATSLVSRR